MMWAWSSLPMMPRPRGGTASTAGRAPARSRNPAGPAEQVGLADSLFAAACWPVCNRRRWADVAGVDVHNPAPDPRALPRTGPRIRWRGSSRSGLAPVRDAAGHQPTQPAEDHPSAADRARQPQADRRVRPIRCPALITGSARSPTAQHRHPGPAGPGTDPPSPDHSRPRHGRASRAVRVVWCRCAATNRIGPGRRARPVHCHVRRTAGHLRCRSGGRATLAAPGEGGERRVRPRPGPRRRGLMLLTCLVGPQSVPRGFQSGVAIIPALVAETVTEPARAAALARPKKEFAAFLLPAIVDLATGQTFSYQGRIVWGTIYASWLRARLAAAL